MTGQYTELYFPSHNVRYIAIDDGVAVSYTHLDVYKRQSKRKDEILFETKWLF